MGGVVVTSGAGDSLADRLVEAAAAQLAVVKSQGLWDKLSERDRVVVMKACTGQAALVLSTTLPLLADAIDSQRITEVVTAEPYRVGRRHGMFAAASVIRSATPEVTA